MKKIDALFIELFLMQYTRTIFYSSCLVLLVVGAMHYFTPLASLLIAFFFVAPGFLLVVRYGELADDVQKIETLLAQMEKDFPKNPVNAYEGLMTYLKGEKGGYGFDRMFTDAYLIRRFFGRFNKLLMDFINQSDKVAVLHMVDVAYAIRTRVSLLEKWEEKNSDTPETIQVREAMLGASGSIISFLKFRKQAILESLPNVMSLDQYLASQIFDIDRFLDKVHAQNELIELAALVTEEQEKKTYKTILLMDLERKAEVLNALAIGAAQ